MPTWNATQYLQFAGERTQPCRDLVARLTLENPRRVIDLGCGPGNSTAILTARWPEAVITGLDSSPAMIEAARAADSRTQWRVGDLATWSEAKPFDLIFSNAALQWVPDHAAVYPRLFQQVAPGGAMAMQVPMNSDAPAHRIMRELAASAAWRNRFTGAVREWQVHEAGFYYDLLAPVAARLDLWQTEYLHILPGAEAIVEWYKGTGLRPFLEALGSPAERERFLEDYLAELRPAYPPRMNGRILFPFLRLFLAAYR